MTRRTTPTADANLVVQMTDDGSRTLLRVDDDAGYHSASGALSETRHVYLKNSGVAERLAAGSATSVLEIGLGTGMGLLLTLDAALRGHAPLVYTAFERQWPSVDVLRQLDPHGWVRRDELASRFLAWRERLGNKVSGGAYYWRVDDACHVNVRVEDVRDTNRFSDTPVDAIYFDPFAPKTNPELWTEVFLAQMYKSLRVGGKLVTYCVSRVVRDACTSAGFVVHCVPGPQAGKREVLIATRES